MLHLARNFEAFRLGFPGKSCCPRIGLTSPQLPSPAALRAWAHPLLAPFGERSDLWKPTFTFRNDARVTPCLIWGRGREKNQNNVPRGFFNNLVFVMRSTDLHGFSLNAGGVSGGVFPVILSAWHCSSTGKRGWGLSYGSAGWAVPPASCSGTVSPSFVSARLPVKLVNAGGGAGHDGGWGVPSLCIPVFSKQMVRPSVRPSCMQSGGRRARPCDMFDTDVLLPCEGCRNCPYLHPNRLLYFSMIYPCTFCQIC